MARELTWHNFFVIGQFAKMYSVLLAKMSMAISQPIEITTMYTSLHTHSPSHSDSPYESLGFSHEKHKLTSKLSVGP